MGVTVKVRKLAAPVGIAAITISMAAITAVPASAANNIKPYGQQETINDYGTGAPMIGYTVTGLNPSSDAVPHNGQLYAANVTVDGMGGWATPIVGMFNARAESGDNYRVIANAPGGPAAAPPGGSSTGTLYFDVVGDVPNSVVYNDGTQDLLVWVPGAAEGGVPGAAGGSGPPDSAGSSTEIIDNAPVGAAESGGDMAAPAEIAPPPEVVSPFETPEQHDRGR
jgi:Domain of unknown function (DUF1942)